MEYINKCKICGKVWCYTDEDINENNRNTLRGTISAIGSMANAVGGSMYNAYEQNKIADKALDKVVDYSRCPQCNSRNIFSLTQKEFKIVEEIEEKAKNGYFINASKDEIIKKIESFIEEKDWLRAELYLEQIILVVPNESRIYFLKIYFDNKVSNEKELIKRCIENNILLKQSENFKNIEEFGTNEDIEKIKQIDDQILEYMNEREGEENDAMYNWAIYIAKNSMNLKELKSAENILVKLWEYEHTGENLKIIEEKIEKIEQKNFSTVVKIILAIFVIGIMVIVGNRIV